MKVRSVILDSLNLELLDSDVGKLSHLIDKIISQKRSPIVLINENGDDLLRKIPKLLECDLVYSSKSTNKYEGLFIGLHGAGACAFYLPSDQDYGDESTWNNLEKNLAQLPYLNTTHMLIPNSVGPWLVTPAGATYLKNKDASYDLEKDSGFNRLKIP